MSEEEINLRLNEEGTTKQWDIVDVDGDEHNDSMMADGVRLYNLYCLPEW